MIVNLNTENKPYFCKIVSYPSVEDYLKAFKMANSEEMKVYPAMFALSCEFGCDSQGNNGSKKTFEDVLKMPYEVFDKLLASLTNMEKVF